MSQVKALRGAGPIARLHDAVSFAGFACGGAALALIVMIYVYEVMMRYFFLAPTMWASDSVTFLLLLSVFLVMPWLTREGGHVAVTLVPDMLPEKAGRLLLRTGFLAGSVACFWSGWISLQENLALFERGTATLSTVRIPKWTLGAFITYGLVNSGIYFLVAGLRGPIVSATERGEHA